MVFVQFKGNEMKLTDIRNSINEISAIGGLKMVVKGNTKEVEGIKLSKEMAQAMIDGLTHLLMVESTRKQLKDHYTSH
tara:strand:- start:82 stop:315 length:234 start_codon:yes stop_codon:yes gene_type:complete